MDPFIEDVPGRLKRDIVAVKPGHEFSHLM